MCGIAGYYSFGTKRPNKKTIENLLINLSSRGKDATGVAYFESNRLKVIKNNLSSTEFIATKEFKKIIVPDMMIMHTRAATKGSPKDNCNNHPLYTKNGLVVVHNGIILNDDILYPNPKDGIVDSRALLYALQDYNNNVDKVFSLLEGSYAVASIDLNYPKQLILFRHNNPIECCYDSKNKILYFASTENIFNNALSDNKTKYEKGFPLNDTRFNHFGFGNDYSMIIGNKGVNSYRKHQAKEIIYAKPIVASPFLFKEEEKNNERYYCETCNSLDCDSCQHLFNQEQNNCEGLCLNCKIENCEFNFNYNREVICN